MGRIEPKPWSAARIAVKAQYFNDLRGPHCDALAAPVDRGGGGNQGIRHRPSAVRGLTDK